MRGPGPGLVPGAWVQQAVWVFEVGSCKEAGDEMAPATGNWVPTSGLCE